MVFGTGIFQINQIISTLLASLLAAGSVSCLWYANRLFVFPVGIFVVALSTAVLPSLAAQAQQRDMWAVQDNLGFALRLVNLVTLPAATGLAVPITTALFFRGAFSVQDIVVTAAALQGLAVGLWPVAATRQITCCLYGLGDTKTPVWGGVVAVFVKIRFSLVLMGSVSFADETNRVAQAVAVLSRTLSVWNLGVIGLAISMSLAAIANLIFQAVALSWHFHPFPWQKWIVSLLWSGLASIMIAIRLWSMIGQIDWFGRNISLPVRVSSLSGAVAVGFLSFVALVWPGGKAEIRALMGMLPERELGFLPQFLQPRQ